MCGSQLTITSGLAVKVYAGAHVVMWCKSVVNNRQRAPIGLRGFVRTRHYPALRDIRSRGLLIRWASRPATFPPQGVSAG